MLGIQHELSGAIFSRTQLCKSDLIGKMSFLSTYLLELNVIDKHIITRIRILTAGIAFGRYRSVFLSCQRC